MAVTTGKPKYLWEEAFLLYLPISATASFYLFADLPAWAWMWALAASVFLWLKTISLTSIQSSGVSTWTLLGYLVWPGLDARSFFTRPNNLAVSPPEVGIALLKTSLGISLFCVSCLFVESSPFVAGWLGMISTVVTLHFGVFHLLSIIWRWLGFTAIPIMDAPILANSLTDFWGRRWNRAFRDVSHRFIFRPLSPLIGSVLALWAVFLVSGLVHDLVITIPAGGGYGLPTAYFLLQAAGIMLQRTEICRRWGYDRGWPGRVATWLFTAGPLGLLFPPDFVYQIVVPMLQWLSKVALGGFA